MSQWILLVVYRVEDSPIRSLIQLCRYRGRGSTYTCKWYTSRCLKCGQEASAKVMGHGEEFSTIPRNIKGLLRRAGELVAGKQTTQNANGGFEYLRLGIHVEGDPIYDVPHGFLELEGIVQDDKGI